MSDTAGLGRGAPGAPAEGGADGGLVGAPTVRRWLEARGAAVGSPEETAAALALLGRFSAFVGIGPDEIVARCLRTTREGARAISAAGRRWADEAIEAFVASEGLSGHEAVATGNRLRSFLIHNGIFLQGRASTA